MKTIQLRTVISFLLTFLVISENSPASEIPVSEIEARRFEIKPAQKSSSGKIYLFDSPTVIPKTGNLILVYDDSKPAMAFRVLKNDDEKKQFVGKRVRRYDGTGDLELKKNYSSIEKIGELITPPPALQKPPVANINEDLDNSALPPPQAESPNKVAATETSALEPPENNTVEENPTQAADFKEPEKTDPELDESASIKELDQIDKETPKDDLEEPEEIEYDEQTRIDPFNNLFSVTTGFFGNSSNFSTSPYLSNGFSISFAKVLITDAFISEKAVQDSLSLEGGIINYSILNKDRKNDRYSLLPFYGNLFYQLHLSRTFTMNAYAGIQFNYMTSADNPGDSLETLQGLQPNFGVGAFFSLGPQWYFRADIGWDRITGGLSIKW